MRRLFDRVLTCAGYRVKAVDSLGGARNALFTPSVHVVVMDEVLPDGSGLAFVRERRGEGWRTPVVWVSGFDRDPQIVEQAREVGVTEVLQKPVRSEERVARVSGLVPPEDPDSDSTGPGPLEAMLGSTRGGLAVQLGGRVAQLAALVQAVVDGRERPLAARRFAAAVRARKTTRLPRSVPGTGPHFGRVVAAERG
jgi:DNA-binding response OmpR family regulator